MTYTSKYSGQNGKVLFQDSQGSQTIFSVFELDKTKWENESGAWYAEAVNRAEIRKLEKIKT